MSLPRLPLSAAQKLAVPAVLALGLAAGGCSVDSRSLVSDAGGAGGTGGGNAPPAIVIDTFEHNTLSDASVQPEDPRFQPWQYYAYNTTIATMSSQIVSPGYDSNYAIDLVWQVTDPPDGVQNYPGAGLRTDPVSYVDLTGYSEIVFAQQYTHPADGCQPVLFVTVMFSCSQYNASFAGNVSLSGTWTTSSYQFAYLTQSNYPSPTPVDQAACFKVIDGLDFQFLQPLADGDCASGDVTLDNISIR